MTNEYDDIRNVKYPFETSRPRMSLHDRAAQFAPFSALTGYGALIDGIVQESSED
ncbi:MAG: hypothetical protein MJY42_00715 [Bacteroidales bacterium]|nr:hypothetical protein [Bacteroidales bacterium]